MNRRTCRDTDISVAGIQCDRRQGIAQGCKKQSRQMSDRKPDVDPSDHDASKKQQHGYQKAQETDGIGRNAALADDRYKHRRNAKQHA